MGTRGPIARGPGARAKSLKSAEGRRLRRLPADADAIARRLARDVAGLTDADMALVEDMAQWVAISKEAFRQLREPLGQPGQPQPQPGQPQQGQADDAAIEAVLALLMTDTAHGNKEEARKSPLLIVMRTASEQIRADAAQLGASPLSRARLPEPERDDESIADVLFAGMNRHERAGHKQGDGRAGG